MNYVGSEEMMEIWVSAISMTGEYARVPTRSSQSTFTDALILLKSMRCDPGARHAVVLTLDSHAMMPGWNQLFFCDSRFHSFWSRMVGWWLVAQIDAIV